MFDHFIFENDMPSYKFPNIAINLSKGQQFMCLLITTNI